MSKMNYVAYGRHQIEFDVEFRDRKTLSIAVEPGGAVLVTAPIIGTMEGVKSKVHKRARWILAQQEYFGQFSPRTPPRRYVPGETHLYLGRQYRLGVDPVGPRRVRMVRGEILVSGVARDDWARIEKLVLGWYRERAEVQFGARLEINRARFANPDRHTPKSLNLRRMKARWGSMSTDGHLLLNPDLVRAPVDAIDYVIIHELCHLAVSGHTRRFYELQEQVLPDWAGRKQRLERMLA